MISDHEARELDITQDERWMREALTQAQHAWDLGEVPVGAVLVKGDQCVARAHNAPIANHDPTAHAEIAVLRAAGQQLQNYRLIDTTLYVSLEPCMMCVGALIHARVSRIVFGAYDPKAGALISQAQLAHASWVNHQCEVIGGILEVECRSLLQAFFKARR